MDQQIKQVSREVSEMPTPPTGYKQATNQKPKAGAVERILGIQGAGTKVHPPYWQKCYILASQIDLYIA